MFNAKSREEIEQFVSVSIHDVEVIAKNDALQIIDKYAEQEPKTGRWIPIEYPTGVEAFGVKEMSAQELKCSECGKTVDISDDDFKYCPYCGSFNFKTVKIDPKVLFSK